MLRGGRPFQQLNDTRAMLRGDDPLPVGHILREGEYRAATDLAPCRDQPVAGR